MLTRIISAVVAAAVLIAVMQLDALVITVCAVVLALWCLVEAYSVFSYQKNPLLEIQNNKKSHLDIGNPNRCILLIEKRYGAGIDGGKKCRYNIKNDKKERVFYDGTETACRF